MQFGGTTLALFFVLRPMFLLTFSIAIPDEHARFTRLETNALSFDAAALAQQTTSISFIPRQY
jgi:hypothetical protein